MGYKGDYKRYLASVFIVCMIISSVLAGAVAAVDESLSLPSTPVLIEVSDGVENFFDTVVSNVPSGYDVVNGTYPGWCVDVRTEMARSPATHSVILYSTSNPPGALADEAWNMVNYILNHKQGTREDIQQAIWYFVSLDGGYTPTRTVAWTMVEEALANGEGFVPDLDQLIAVICYPTILFPSQPDVQISIIEVHNTVIPETTTLLMLPLFMTLSLLTAIAYRKRHST